jgi:3-hydroxy-9,10-secoandrosta-1,3,5(10)-triene-9,17-dione monooxygenase reductase component
MAIDIREFRQTAAQFATGVTVVALELDGEVRAMTVNSFTSVSLDPPLLLVCLGKNTRAGQRIHGASRFCVCVLHDHQRDLSAFFAGAWKQPSPPRFSFADWEGAPRLDGAIAAFLCTVHAIHEAGDHWIVVGQVTALQRVEHECRPLVFYAGGYVDLEPRGVRLEDAPLGIAWSGPWGYNEGLPQLNLQAPCSARTGGAGPAGRAPRSTPRSIRT